MYQTIIDCHFLNNLNFMAAYIYLEMSNMNKGINSKCGGSQESLAKRTRTLTSYFGGKNQEATSSQVHLQDSQPLPLLVPMAHIEEVGKRDISDYDDLEEYLQVNTQRSQDLQVNTQSNQNNIIDLDKNSKDGDGSQSRKGKRKCNAKIGVKFHKNWYWDINQEFY